VFFLSIFTTSISVTSTFLPHHLKILFLLFNYKFKNFKFLFIYFFLKKKRKENKGFGGGQRATPKMASATSGVARWLGVAQNPPSGSRSSARPPPALGGGSQVVKMDEKIKE
jgi:hypothetical protein